MNTNEFLLALANVVGTTKCLRTDTLLEDVPEWDSLSAMSTVTFLATQGLANVTLAELQRIKTVGDILVMAKGALS